MSSNNSQSKLAEDYLNELRSALAGAPAALQTEILADVAGGFDGLTDEETRARIAELGDPHVIAADATVDDSIAAGPSTPVEQPVTKGYATATGIVLTAGWYLVPVLGWIAGLVMIGIGDHWTPQIRRRSILISIGAALVSVAGIMIFRGTDVWLIGVIIFLAVPIIVNAFVSDHLRRTWR